MIREIAAAVSSVSRKARRRSQKTRLSLFEELVVIVFNGNQSSSVMFFDLLTPVTNEVAIEIETQFVKEACESKK